MKIRIFDVGSYNDNYYMSHMAHAGTVVGYEKREAGGFVSAKPWDGSGMPVGVLMSDVVNRDLSKQHLNFSANEVQIGSKIRIMVQGKLVISFGKGLRLPAGQPIYVDPKTGFLTWKCLSVQVGKLRRPQDKDGNCLVEVNF